MAWEKIRSESLKMANSESQSFSKVSIFDGNNYVPWKQRMETYLKSLGFGMYKSLKIAYVEPTIDITDINELKKYEVENKAKNALMSALTDAKLARVSGCESAKVVWDKLKGTYEGDDKIKEVKLQHFRAQFEGIRM